MSGTGVPRVYREEYIPRVVYLSIPRVVYIPGIPPYTHGCIYRDTSLYTRVYHTGTSHTHGGIPACLPYPQWYTSMSPILTGVTLGAPLTPTGVTLGAPLTPTEVYTRHASHPRRYIPWDIPAQKGENVPDVQECAESARM